MTATVQKTGPGKFIIGDNADITVFETQVTSITLEPDVKSEDDMLVLSGDTVAGADTETWTVKGKLNADLGAKTSVQEYCFTHAGQAKPFKFTPATASGRQFEGVLKIRPTAFGGDVGSTSQVDFEFPVIGRPTLTPITGG
ncbi:PadR family transcriptional regulator [Leifsonia xyli subsp. cynodontis DSM 46306]|uniref:Uncharacterized protein n=1 Tax=Leifsonia xyli subsp. cynodontis DSM 46306 TaxID=1389489 RepID=U3P847_LEIXC|nr:hypothetical protein [Leifsonia xyli]AGW42455.1 PadR family transcriptional regulator [Leifsonia xyli subsp. cynodontis DSM 46306]